MLTQVVCSLSFCSNCWMRNHYCFMWPLFPSVPPTGHHAFNLLYEISMTMFIARRRHYCHWSYTSRLDVRQFCGKIDLRRATGKQKWNMCIGNNYRQTMQYSMLAISNCYDNKYLVFLSFILRSSRLLMYSFYSSLILIYHFCSSKHSVLPYPCKCSPVSFQSTPAQTGI